MRKGNERGAIVVEATISLSAFMFAIFMILSIVNICFIQAKIGIALNTAAKEISQYSHLYYALGVNNLEAQFNEGTQDSKQLAQDTIDGLGIMMSSLAGAQQDLQSGDFEGMVGQLDQGVTNTESLITQYSDKINEDPTGFILGMGKMATNELKEEGKVLLAQILAKSFMKKNLISSPGGDPDAYLKSYGVVDGMDGLNFNYTSFLAYGTSNEIQLVCTYEVKVLQLLNVDFKFKIRQMSKTTAWGNGVSLINPVSETPPDGNIWQMGGYATRGKLIVENEKKEFDYTNSGNGFDGYNNTNGKNEFVTVTSIDTSLSTYENNPSKIKDRLNAVYDVMERNVQDVGEEVTVKDKNGNDVKVTSDPDTRTYQMVLVVPDDADLSVVQAGIDKFQEENPDVTVVIKQGYGEANPSEPASEPES